MRVASANGRFWKEKDFDHFGLVSGQPFFGSIVLPVSALNITHCF